VGQGRSARLGIRLARLGFPAPTCTRRIEELEEREREREELLAELAPAMEARGYDTGAVKAVLNR
jgi:hypothetical protein